MTSLECPNTHASPALSHWYGYAMWIGMPFFT
jgi:hypothetical protein